jgi:hypothetical protein
MPRVPVLCIRGLKAEVLATSSIDHRLKPVVCAGCRAEFTDLGFHFEAMH